MRSKSSWNIILSMTFMTGASLPSMMVKKGSVLYWYWKFVLDLLLHFWRIVQPSLVLVFLKISVPTWKHFSVQSIFLLQFYNPNYHWKRKSCLNLYALIVAYFSQASKIWTWNKTVISFASINDAFSINYIYIKLHLSCLLTYIFQWLVTNIRLVVSPPDEKNRLSQLSPLCQHFLPECLCKSRSNPHCIFRLPKVRFLKLGQKQSHVNGTTHLILLLSTFLFTRTMPTKTLKTSTCKMNKFWLSWIFMVMLISFTCMIVAH